MKEPLIDYDYGPVAISDISQGLHYKVWTGTYDGTNVLYTIDGGLPQVIFAVPNVNELSITFDQNGRPSFGFCDDAGSHLYWYDSVTQAYEVLDVGLTAYNPRVMLDDKRGFNIPNSDVLFCYLLSGNLCIRYQRERFGVEHILDHVGQLAELVNIGMSDKNRMQFMLKVVV